MPKRALRPCRKPGCPALIRSPDGWCDAHRKQVRKEADAKKPSYHRWYGSTAWKRMRAEHLVEHPFCERCDKAGNVVHHKIPHNGSRELFFDTSNLETSCVTCHNKEHERGAVSC